MTDGCPEVCRAPHWPASDALIRRGCGDGAAWGLAGGRGGCLLTAYISFDALKSQSLKKSLITEVFRQNTEAQEGDFAHDSRLWRQRVRV